MALIINRGPYHFLALIRRQGYLSQTNTFESHKALVDWEHDVEAKMRRASMAKKIIAMNGLSKFKARFKYLLRVKSSLFLK